MSRLRAGAVLTAVLSLGVLAPAAAAPSARAIGDTRVFAKVPKPGFPAYVYVKPHGRVYVGSYTDPAGDPTPSKVFEYTRAGRLARSWTVPGQDLTAEHGVQVATSDAAGRLVLLEKSTARVMRLNTRTGRFTTYAVLRDLPTCPPGAKPLPAGCSPNVADLPAIPNYAAWLPDGSLLVTDYGQAVIWRVPPGGGRPRVWFRSAKLDGTEFGTTGLVLLPGHHGVLIGQQSTALDGSVPVDGKVYRLGLDRRLRPARLRTLWTSQPGDLPDGFGLARSGHLYVSLAGLANQVVELSGRGTELRRFGTRVSGENGSPIPFDTPSSATFLGRRVLVANQAFFGDRTHHAVLDLWVGERGAPVFIPANAGRKAGPGRRS